MTGQSNDGHPDLESALRASAAAPTPLPDPGFVDRLERRLVGVPSGGMVVPFARRARRVSAGVVLGGVITFAGVAAAAGIVVTHPFRDNSPAATAETSTVVETTGASSSLPVEEPTTIPATEPPRMLPVTLPVTPPVTVPHTEPPTTKPAVTAPHEPTTITEVRVPATMSLNCVSTGGSVQCTWSEGPVGTGHYLILRSDGQAFTAEHTLTWTDPATVVGNVSYLVHAIQAYTTVSLAHSERVALTCC